MSIEFGKELDLHHFHPRDTGPVLLEFLRQAAERGYRRLRVVHGKGMSQKKMLVHEILGKHPRVQGFSDDGANWGATIVYIRDT
jgi:DNA-nicking Smr family endonuclease